MVHQLVVGMVLTFFVTSAGTVRGQESVDRIRFLYVNEDGIGEFKKFGKDQWKEIHPQGFEFIFSETKRTAEYIELLDSTSTRGGVSVRLYKKTSTWKHDKHTEGEWRELWNGAWQKK